MGQPRLLILNTVNACAGLYKDFRNARQLRCGSDGGLASLPANHLSRKNDRRVLMPKPPIKASFELLLPQRIDSKNPICYLPQTHQ
jgi:hypothetical protein